MNERERWIVYPLLFFALGASLRDKFLQHISTKEIECQRLVAKSIECEGGIACEGVVVFDTDDRTQRLVELGRADAVEGAAGQPSRRFGVLVLRDSGGQELCGVANNELYVRRIICEGVRIVDPNAPQRTLAGLGSAAAAGPDGVSRPFGILVLNNEPFATVIGNPPPEAVEPRPGNETPADPEDPPPDGGERGNNPDESAG